MESGYALTEGRIQRIGGGRKKVIDTDKTLLDDLDVLIIDTNNTKGNPMNFVKWTNKAVAKLAKGLRQMGHRIKNTAVYNILRNNHYSLRGNRKDDEGYYPDSREIIR